MERDHHNAQDDHGEDHHRRGRPRVLRPNRQLVARYPPHEPPRRAGTSFVSETSSNSNWTDHEEDNKKQPWTDNSSNYSDDHVSSSESEMDSSDDDDNNNNNRKKRRFHKTGRKSGNDQELEGETPAKKRAREDPSTTKKKAVAQGQGMMLTDLTTVDGQLAAHPHFTKQQARMEAKKEYNRQNAARARRRNKARVEFLEISVQELTDRCVQLEEENELLKEDIKRSETDGNVDSPVISPPSKKIVSNKSWTESKTESKQKDSLSSKVSAPDERSKIDGSTPDERSKIDGPANWKASIVAAAPSAMAASHAQALPATFQGAGGSPSVILSSLPTSSNAANLSQIQTLLSLISKHPASTAPATVPSSASSSSETGALSQALSGNGLMGALALLSNQKPVARPSELAIPISQVTQRPVISQDNLQLMTHLLTSSLGGNQLTGGTSIAPLISYNPPASFNSPGAILAQLLGNVGNPSTVPNNSASHPPQARPNASFQSMLNQLLSSGGAHPAVATHSSAVDNSSGAQSMAVQQATPSANFLAPSGPSPLTALNLQRHARESSSFNLASHQLDGTALLAQLLGQRPIINLPGNVSSYSGAGNHP